MARALEFREVRPDATYPWLAGLVGWSTIARTTGEPTWLVSVHLRASRIADAVLARIPVDGIELTAPTRKAGGFTHGLGADHHSA